MKTLILFSIVFIGISHVTFGQVCLHRSQDNALTIQEPLLNESSGMAFSKRFPERLYHINDSGSDPEFFYTDHDGNHSQRIPIQLGLYLDTEDMAVGPCLGEASCLVIGDIGDNLRFRPSIQFYFFKESNLTAPGAGQSLQPDLVLSVSYPDRSHNAESFFLDKTGNLTLITKEKKGNTAQIFSLSAEQIHLAANHPTTANPKLTLKGKISLKPMLPPSFAAVNTEITGASYNASTDTVAILTYDGVFEVALSSLTSQRSSASDYVYTPVRAGKQQEAISFLPGSSDLFISSEMGKDGPAPLLRLRCEK